MMSGVQHHAFALAKIQPPRLRAHTIIAREALESRLGDAVRRVPLTLLCAAAGFGKTVALSRLIHTLEPAVRIAWVSVDEDDDLTRFIACLCAALEPFDLPWRQSPETLAARACETRIERRQVADEWSNTLAGADVERGLLVLDDMHRITDPAVFDWLSLLLEQLPPQWGIVIGSRVEPPLPLARLRASDALVEFRQIDLCFSGDELALMLKGFPDTGTLSVDDLLARTQGWPAGVRLSLNTDRVARSPRSPHSGAARRELFDYLAAEVLDDMPTGLRDFLLRCSVLAELTAARCERLTGDPKTFHWLEETERRGLFVTVLDSEELTLRLHDLFRDFLEDRLRCDAADEWRALLVRAADDEDDVMRRVNLLLRAGAWPEAEQALARSVSAMLSTGGGAQVLRLVEQFPRGQQESSPMLAFVRGLCAWPRFEWVTMHHAMERASQGFARLGLAAEQTQADTLRTIPLMALGRLDEASRCLDELEGRALNRDTHALFELMSYWRAGACGPALGPATHLTRLLGLLEGDPARGVPVADASQWYRGAPHFMFVGRAGMRAPMQRFVQGALRVAGEEHAPLRAAANTLAAWLLLWEGRLDDARALMLEVQNDDRWLGQLRSLRIPILSFQATWHTMRGDLVGMNAASQALIDDVHADPERITWRGVYLCMVGRLSAALDDRDGLRKALERLAHTPTELEWPHLRGARLVLQGHAAMDAGRLDEAEAMLRSALLDSADVDTLSLDVAVRVTLARVLLRQGDAAAAWAAVLPAVRLARSEGEPGALRVMGTRACAELASAACQADGAPEQAWLASAVRSWAIDPPVAIPSPVGSGIEHAASPRFDGTLTEREHQVLAQIAAGDSNKLIARALELSPHTVKRHVANILDKLNLSSRVQAAAWYVAQRDTT